MTIFKYLLCAAVLAGAIYLALPFYTQASSSHQKAPLIPRQYLFGNPVKTAAKISPDGTKLAYLAPDEKNVLNVWVRDLQLGGKDKQVTSDHQRGIRQYLWQFDNAHILYIQDKEGDENYHLYQTNLETQETKDLTPYDGIKIEIVDADPSHPDEMLIGMNRRDPELFDVYRLNFKSGGLTLDTENPGGVIGWVADNDLQVRASQSYASDGSTLIRIRDNAQSPWRDFMTFDPLEIGEVESFSRIIRHCMS